MAGVRPIQRSRELLRFVRLHLPASKSLVCRHEALPRCGVEDRVVVSLTTIPDRIGRIRPTLLSLLDQTRRPDRIVLNLPKTSHREGRDYVIPPFVEALSACIDIHRCDRDWGPATKLLPTLEIEREPNTRIVVVDDDQVYPRNMIEELVAWSERLPEAAPCSRGHGIPPGNVHEDRDTHYGTDVGRPIPVEIMQGSAGFLVRRRFCSDEIFDYGEAPPESFFVDDIWFAGHLAGRKVERFVVPFSNCYSRIASWSARRSLSLSHAENRGNRNTETLYHHFADRWTVLDR